MKKALIILGSIFLVLLVLGMISFIILTIKGTLLDKESKEYIDGVTPIILANLSRETLFQYASNELKDSAPVEEFDKIFSWFSKLGKFKEYKGSKGQVDVSLTMKSGKKITGKYEAQAEFENGLAIVKITTIKEKDGWEILGFHIDSMAFAK